MSRFQAKTNALLDADLEELREQLGLRGNQKADLLRELTALASWVVHQAREGRQVQARSAKGDVRELDHSVLERIRSRQTVAIPTTVELSADEARRLRAILARGFSSAPGLRAALRRLAAPDRAPPRLRWPGRNPAADPKSVVAARRSASAKN